MEESAPCISVVMPLYNTERYVAESIESVLAQTLPDFELLIVDDCSTDGSYAVAERYARRDPRIRLLHNERNLGAAETRNRGLDAARGEYLAFMDADDRCVPERLALQREYLDSHPEIGLCGSYYTVLYQDGTEKLLKTPLTHPDIAAELLFGCPFGMSSVMMRREALLRSGVRIQTCKAEDYRFWADLSDRMRMASIPRSLFLYRRWENQISTSQLDLQNQSAQSVQTELLARKLALRFAQPEADLLFAVTHRTGPITREEAARYKKLLGRIYRANKRTGQFDRSALRRQLTLRYKRACLGCMPRCETRIRKLFFALTLCL